MFLDHNTCILFMKPNFLMEFCLENHGSFNTTKMPQCKNNMSVLNQILDTRSLSTC